MPKLTTLSPFARFEKRWKDCQACALCKTRNHLVLCRGCIPCQILFIGEAPGASEDVLGKPFAGPAGHLLDRMVTASGAFECRCCFTNLVCCIPKDETNSKLGEPPLEAIEACDPRLQEFVKLCNPDLIVCVGKLAGKWISGHYGYYSADEFIEIIHPAAILRADVSQQGLAYQRAVVTLRDAVENL